jgi:RNA polymerase sigma factor (sigma-70 family)
LGENERDGQLLLRFARYQDEAAFSALVRRHGPMVLGVCRRVLQQEQDAEDAFQATFMVLVRKVRTIEQPELLANWLYGVAYRIARKARASASRRRGYESQAKVMGTADPTVGLNWRELRAVLDDALARLPEKYRVPLILCYLEGKTNEEAAVQLGWPVGSISARLSRGRELLRERLAQRDWEPLLLAGFFPLLTWEMNTLTVPQHLLDAAVQGMLELVRGTTASASAISPGARRLMESTAPPSRTSPLKLAAILLAILALTFGASMIVQAALAHSLPTIETTNPGSDTTGSCH